jgi:membrane fusion protein (multidrug efflux system)
MAAAIAGCGKKDEGASAAQTKPAEPGKAGAPAPAAAAAPPKPMGLPVKAQTVTVAKVDSEVTAVGTLIASEAVVLRPEIAGRIIELNFQEGQAVQKGAKLVTFDPSEYQAQVAGSSAEARTETQRYERAKEMLEQKFISQEALDVARGNMDGANARKRQDEVQLSKSMISAPFSGIVGLRLVSPGAYIKAGEDIARLENISSLKLDFRVPEVYLSKIRPKQDLSIRVDAYPSDVFPGRIYALEPSVDEKTRTVVVRAEIPNQHAKLRPGMFARVNVLLERDPTRSWCPSRPSGRRVATPTSTRWSMARRC